MRIKAPLFDKISNYCGIRYHMPSHNGKNILPLFASSKFDITELSFSDNLLYSNGGVINEAESLAATAYNVSYTRFFTAGATSAIFAALLAIKELGLSPLIVGKCHSAVYNALDILSITYKKTDNINAEALKNIQAVIITSPDVYGTTQDIKGIKELIGDRLLVVDEAHGAHFAFSSLLPLSATKYADITINSMHKTLPVYSGGALVHTNSDKLDKLIIDSRRALHTTSPSYLVMASMDWARAHFEQYGESLYKKIYDAIRLLKLPEGYTKYQNHDFSRLVLSTGGRGREVYKALEKANIYAEMYDEDCVVFIVTPYNVDNLCKITQVLEQRIKKEAKPKTDKYMALVGTVAKEDIGLYPPCIPVILKGEVIEADKLQYILSNVERAYGLIDES